MIDEIHSFTSIADPEYGYEASLLRFTPDIFLNEIGDGDQMRERYAEKRCSDMKV